MDTDELWREFLEFTEKRNSERQELFEFVVLSDVKDLELSENVVLDKMDEEQELILEENQEDISESVDSIQIDENYEEEIDLMEDEEAKLFEDHLNELSLMEKEEETELGKLEKLLLNSNESTPVETEKLPNDGNSSDEQDESQVHRILSRDLDAYISTAESLSLKNESLKRHLEVLTKQREQLLSEIAFDKSSIVTQKEAQLSLNQWYEQTQKTANESLDELTKAISIKKKIRDELLKQISNYAKEYNQLKEELLSDQKEIKERLVQREALVQELSGLTENATVVIFRLESEALSLEKELREKKESNQKLQVIKEELARELKQVTIEVANDKNLINEKSTLRDELISEIASIELQAEEAIQEAVRVLDNLEPLLQDKREATRQLQRRVDNQEIEKETILLMIKPQQEEHLLYIKDVSRLKASIFSLEKKIAELLRKKDPKIQFDAVKKIQKFWKRVKERRGRESEKRTIVEMSSEVSLVNEEDLPAVQIDDYKYISHQLEREHWDQRPATPEVNIYANAAIFARPFGVQMSSDTLVDEIEEELMNQNKYMKPQKYPTRVENTLKLPDISQSKSNQVVYQWNVKKPIPNHLMRGSRPSSAASNDSNSSWASSSFMNCTSSQDNYDPRGWQRLRQRKRAINHRN